MAERREVARKLPERPGDRELAALGREVIDALREDERGLFDRFIAAFAGKAADIALVGQGKFNVGVDHDGIHVQEFVQGGTVAVRVLATPAALVAVARGEIAPLEAFFRGELVGYGHSENIHTVYELVLGFVDAVGRSQLLQDVVAKFAKHCGV